jgi:hypothetical protein
MAVEPPDEEQRAHDVAAAMDEFTQRLTAAIERHQRGQKDPEEPWDEHDYERLLRESDARTDKYMELLEKYGDSDEAEAKIAKDMGWDEDEELTEEEAERQREWIDRESRHGRLSREGNGRESRAATSIQLYGGRPRA